MKFIDHLRRSLLCCTTTPTAPSSSSPIPHRRSNSNAATTYQDQEISLIDAAANANPTATSRPSTSSRSTVVGTIFGPRRGHVSFCVQSDPTVPPPFLFQISLPIQTLAHEMRSGLLRVVLDGTHRSSARGQQWKAYCNGKHVGYAVRRKLTDQDCAILKTVRSMSAGAGVLEEETEEEVLYLRASYKRVVGSTDSVSYHLINPAGGSLSPSSDHQQQQLSVFVMRNA